MSFCIPSVYLYCTLETSNHLPLVRETRGRQEYKQLPKELIKPLSENRLLIISVSLAPRQSEQTADERNRYIADIADRIVFGCLNPEGKLAELYRQIADEGKETMVL